MLTYPGGLWWPTHTARFAKLERLLKNLCCQTNSNSSQLGRHHASFAGAEKVKMGSKQSFAAICLNVRVADRATVPYGSIKG